MNPNERLTQQELEQLARLYIDGRLSRLEERELEYVLGCVGYSSPLLDDVRALAGIAANIKKPARHTVPARSFFRRINVAAGIAVVAVSALAISAIMRFSGSGAMYGESSAVYVHGHRITGADAERVAEADMARAMAFMADVEGQACAERVNSMQTINELKNLR